MLTETIVSGSIIAVSVLGLAGSLKLLGENKQLSENVSQVVALESALVTSIYSAENYSEEIQLALQQGQIPTQLTFTLDVGSNGPQPLQIPVGSIVNIDSHLMPCSPDSQICKFQIELQMRDVLPGNEEQYAFAYAIRLLNEQGQPRETLVGTDQFRNADFQLVLSRELYTSFGLQSCNGPEAVATGYNSETGELLCLQKPTNSCPPGEVANGIFVQGSALVIRCVRVLPQVQCADAKFSLQNVLSSGSAVSASCIYGADETGSLGQDIAGANQGITGTVCPSDYVVSTNSFCQIHEVQNTIGRCTRTVYDRQNGPELGPVTDRPGYEGLNCYYRNVTFSPRIEEYALENLQGAIAISNPPQSNPRNKSCALEIPRAVCGASWQGDVDYNPQCTLSNEFQIPRPAVVQ